MAQSFLACDREQELLLPPWLPEGHLAWFVIDAVAEMDLSAFYAAYRGDGHGRAAHDPAMMVALLLYAYAVGRRSSRVIERACVDDVAFRVIAANQRPPITARSRVFASATRRRWPGCSAMCWRSARTPAWSGWRSWRWTARSCTRTPRSTRTSITTRSPRRSWPRRTPSTAPRTSVLASGAAMSCPRSWRRRRAGAAGYVMPSAAWMSGAPPRRGRLRSRARRGCARASAAWRKSTTCTARRMRPTRTIARAG